MRAALAREWPLVFQIDRRLVTIIVSVLELMRSLLQLGEFILVAHKGILLPLHHFQSFLHLLLTEDSPSTIILRLNWGNTVSISKLGGRIVNHGGIPVLHGVELVDVLVKIEERSLMLDVFLPLVKYFLFSLLLRCVELFLAFDVSFNQLLDFWLVGLGVLTLLDLIEAVKGAPGVEEPAGALAGLEAVLHGLQVGHGLRSTVDNCL